MGYSIYDYSNDYEDSRWDADQAYPRNNEPADYEKARYNAQSHMEQVLYWLFKSDNFDEVAFRRALEETCDYLELGFNSERPFKRKIS